MTNHNERLSPVDPGVMPETDVATQIELPSEMTDVSVPRRIVRASGNIFGHIVRIVAKGDPISAMREGANHL